MTSRAERFLAQRRVGRHAHSLRGVATVSQVDKDTSTVSPACPNHCIARQKTPHADRRIKMFIALLDKIKSHHYSIVSANKLKTMLHYNTVTT